MVQLYPGNPYVVHFYGILCYLMVFVKQNVPQYIIVNHDIVPWYIVVHYGHYGTLCKSGECPYTV